MKTITKEFKVFTFLELSDETQEKVLRDNYDINVNFDWWDFIYEDASNMLLKLTHFDIDRNDIGGEFVEYASDTARKILADTWKASPLYILAEKYLADCKIIEAKEETQETEEEAVELEEEFLHALLEEYLVMLKQDYRYQTSKEAILETFEANEYTFLEDGSIFNE